MDTETVIRVSDPRELLAFLPYRLGFTPRESLVLAGLRPPRNRVGLVVRVDLADAGHPVSGPGYARTVVRHLLEDGASDAFAVVYTDRARTDLGGHADVTAAIANLRAVVDWADPPGPWVVGPEGYGVWGDGEACSPEVDPLEDLQTTQTGATMVLLGRAVAADRSALAARRDAPPARRRAAIRAAGAARQRYAEVRGRCGGGASRPGAAFGLVGARPGADQAPMRAWRRGERTRWDRLVAAAGRGEELPAPELGRMLVGLGDLVVRDDVLVSLVGPPPVGARPDEAVTWALTQVFDPGGIAPSPERTEPATVVLEEVVRCAARGAGAPALVLLAWLAWWTGAGAGADVLVRQALAEEPGHTLGRLIASAVDSSLPPGWVRNR